jgi:hypothetical protein
MGIFDSCQGQGNHEKNKCNGQHISFPGEPERYCRWHNIDYSLDANPEYAGPMWQFLEAEEINLCPVFAKVGSKRYMEHENHRDEIAFDPLFGYSQNAYLGSNWDNFPEGNVIKASEVKSPTRTFVWAEENMWTIPGISTAVLNDTSLLARIDPGSPSSIADAFATFHSAKDPEMNEGTGNAVMMDGSIEAVQPYNDGTFRKAWPRLGGVFKKDDRP